MYTNPKKYAEDNNITIEQAEKRCKHFLEVDKFIEDILQNEGNFLKGTRFEGRPDVLFSSISIDIVNVFSLIYEDMGEEEKEEILGGRWDEFVQKDTEEIREMWKTIVRDVKGCRG